MSSFLEFFGVLGVFGRFLDWGLDRTLWYYTLLFILNEIFFTIYGTKKYL
jgi:hypothetical protein